MHAIRSLAVCLFAGLVLFASCRVGTDGGLGSQDARDGPGAVDDEAAATWRVEPIGPVTPEPNLPKLVPLPQPVPEPADLTEFLTDDWVDFDFPARPADHLSGLPEITSTDRLMLHLALHDAVLVLDLGSRTTQTIPGWRITRSQMADRAERVPMLRSGPKSQTVGWMDWTGSERARSEPQSDDAYETRLGDGGLVLTDFDARTVTVLNPDGRLRCQAELVWPLRVRIQDRWWNTETGEVFDALDCSVGIVMPTVDGVVEEVKVRGDDMYVALDDEIVRFQHGATGWQQAARRNFEEASGVHLFGDQVWASRYGGRLVALDPLTLETMDRFDVGSCEWILPFEAGGRFYVLNDCDSTLYRLESGGWSEWDLPDDQVQDTSFDVLGATPAGIWLVNWEQTHEPFHFSYACECFERLPDEVRDLFPTAWGFALRPN